MASGVHHSLCDYMAGVGTLEKSLVEVELLWVRMVDHLVMVVTQKIQSPLVDQVTEHGNVPWLFQGIFSQLLCAMYQL
jgi:hypothetical protein